MASEREITLGDVGRVLWRGRWTIVATTVIAALAAFAITFASDTTYTATSRVYLGQATTMMGNLASTPGTNPLTAATMLQGDHVVGAVSEATGLTPGTVRARTDVSVPRAPGTVVTNQPAIASIAATMADRDAAVRLANAYARAALGTASTGYEAVSVTLEKQVRDLYAEEVRLQALAGQQPSPDTLTQLADLRELLAVSELQLARVRQIEAPAIVTLATGASSSASTSNRVRTAIVGGVIGLLLGLVIALATRGGIRRAAEPA